MNEETVVKEKKGVKVSVVILLCVIFSLIFGIGGWFLGTKLANSEDKKNDNEVKEESKENNENNKNELPNKNDKYTFVKMDTEEINFGSESVKAYFYYYIDKDVAYNMYEEYDCYALRRDMFINNKLVGDTFVIGYYNTQAEASSDIDNFRLREVKTLKDTKNDAYYSLIDIESSVFGDLNHTGRTAFLVDKNGTVLKEMESDFVLLGLVGVFADEKMIEGKYHSKIEVIADDGVEYPKGKDYYLYPDNRLIDVYESHLYYLSQHSEKDTCTFKEFKLLVENGKVNEELIATYTPDDVNGVGQMC